MVNKICPGCSEERPGEDFQINNLVLNPKDGTVVVEGFVTVHECKYCLSDQKYLVGSIYDP